jgi:SP family general alpha glucoside:H+ symporter-like MFS transporter
MLIAISATFSRISILEESAFRVIFACAWVFPAILALGLPFIPESPAWLVSKNEHAKARKALEKLTNGRDPREVDSRLAQLDATAELERTQASESNSVSFIDCFRGNNLRRTLIVMLCNYMPKAVGAPLSANAPYFLNQTGLDSKTVVMLLEIGVSFGVISAIGNVFLLMRLRQRPLMLSGLALCVAMYLMMGIAGTMPRTQPVMLVIGIAVQVTPFSYGPSVGSSNAVAGETSALRLRSKTLGIGTAFQYLASVIWLIIIPYLINSDQLNLGGNIGWIYVVQGVIYTALLYFFVPGTKGRSFEELDDMFEIGVSARKFEKWTLERTSA